MNTEIEQPLSWPEDIEDKIKELVQRLDQIEYNIGSNYINQERITPRQNIESYNETYDPGSVNDEYWIDQATIQINGSQHSFMLINKELFQIIMEKLVKLEKATGLIDDQNQILYEMTSMRDQAKELLEETKELSRRIESVAIGEKDILLGKE